MPDQSFGRRASDQVAVQQGITLAEHGAYLKAHAEEIEKFRNFKHEMNNAVHGLIGKVENIAEGMKTVVGLSERVGAVENEQAKHTAKCDERYERIAEYMKESKEDRAAINQKISDGSNRVLLALLVACVSIIAALLWRFGLPPMGS
jgi:hypothetical protein